MGEKCAYCQNDATTECAMGLPACQNHKGAADEYYETRTGRKPDQDAYLFCEEHGDLWQSHCVRCERCCRYHYGVSVKEKFGDKKTPEERGVTIINLEESQ